MQGWAVAASLWLILVITRNTGTWSYILRAPQALNSSSAAAIMRHALLPLLATASLALLAWGLGRRLLLRLKIAAPENPGVDACLAFGLGLGLIATALFALGMLGALNRAGLAAVAIGAAALAWPCLKPRQAPRPPPLSLARGILAAVFSYAAWHAAVTALAPPTEWDSLAYHLALPKIYLAAGKIIELPWLMHSHWPHLMETLYSLPLALGMDNIPGLLHASACAALVLALFHMGRQFLGAGAALAGAALLAAQPELLALAGTPHNDGALALFHFLAASAVWFWAKTRTRSWLITAGLLSGLGAATKLFGIVLTLILSSWILLNSLRKERRLGAGVREAGLFLGCALAVVAPWYAKTWAATGNPVWPFFSDILGGAWGPRQVEWYLLSYDLTYLLTDSSSFLSSFLHHQPQYLLIPPLGLSLVALARRKPWPEFLLFLLMPVIPYCLAVDRNQEWRYLMPLWPAFALTAGWWAGALAQGRPATKAAVLLIFSFGLTGILTASQNNELFAVLSLRSLSHPEQDSRSLYLSKRLDHYKIYAAINRNVKEPAKILLFQELRGYYLDVDYQWGDPMNQGMIQYAAIKNPNELRESLARHAITHVLINKAVPLYRDLPGYYDRHTRTLMDGLLARHAQLLLDDGEISLYRLN